MCSEAGGHALNGLAAGAKASQQCFITRNNIRNEVLVFICFNFLQMCSHGRHSYNAQRCDVRQSDVEILTTERVLKVTEVSVDQQRNDL